MDEVLQLPVDVQGLDGELVLGGDEDPVDVELAAEPREVGHPTEVSASPLSSSLSLVVDDAPTSVMPASWRTLSMMRSAVVPAPTTSTRVVVNVWRKERRTMRPTVMVAMVTITAMTSWVA